MATGPAPVTPLAPRAPHRSEGTPGWVPAASGSAPLRAGGGAVEGDPTAGRTPEGPDGLETFLARVVGHAREVYRATVPVPLARAGRGAAVMLLRR